jgi:hypothetical protein
MAEQVMIVCDVCGAPATASVNMQVHGGGTRDGQRFAKDLCNTHLNDLVTNTRKPRRGRRRATVATAAAPASAPSPRARRSTRSPAAKTGATTGRRRGRPRATPAPAAPAEGAAT